MKIVIKGHESRGKEVIQFLESLGGRNQMLHTGRYTGYFYYINNDNIITWTSVRPRRSNIFTLEEFEKEFPFKIGDKVKHISSTGIIKGYCYMSNEPAYVVESMELGIIATIPVKLLKSYKEMEERNITLTLDKAKEWYKRGGELKEVALQAFSEKELTKVGLPETWEEFCKNYPRKVGEAYIDMMSFICCSDIGDFNREPYRDKNICPSKKSAEAHLALIQLEQLRDCWRQGWVQTPTDTGYRINRKLDGDYVVSSVGSFKYFLAFPTYEMAKEFLKCFRDLIEKAKDLI